MTLMEAIALGALICNVILTSLALWRGCQAVKEIRELRREQSVYHNGRNVGSFVVPFLLLVMLAPAMADGTPNSAALFAPGTFPVRAAADQTSGHAVLKTNVFVGPGMALTASFSFLVRNPSNVFLESDALHVGWVNAARISAQVVNRQTVRDWSADSLVDIAMCVDGFVWPFEAPIPSREVCPYPKPASIRFLDFGKKPLIVDIHRKNIGHNGLIIKVQNHSHSPQDEELHHSFYQNWMRPDKPNESCCNLRDCAPAKSVRRIGNRWEAQRESDDVWVVVPSEKIEQRRDSPDGRSHLCSRGLSVFCFVAGSGT